ncbi:hypothetical protein TGAMA5MH_02796 [Trichoderma gamsii]|uniref:Uncharacterized protein n=1 Tax=Trichoderma gamsii TaxID=398673 RepID=A0A2K0TJ68_9HYPO|nr:hypothetical protein TGAMA5MH_02796 [Trichoderma gamsii]
MYLGEHGEWMEESSRGLIWNQGGFNAFEQGTALTQARELARKAIQTGKDEYPIRFALNAMQAAAGEYLAVIWSQGSLYDLIAVQCLYNSSRASGPTSSKTTKKKTKKPKGEDGKRIQKRTGKDVGKSQLLNQGTGLAMARNVMIREMLTCNRKISETLQKNNEISGTLWKTKKSSEMLEISKTLQKNNEILKKLLHSPTEEDERHDPTHFQG